MNYRIVLCFAIAGFLASSGFARADGLIKPELSLDPTVVTADDATASAPAPAPAPEPSPLMGALDTIGVGKTLADANFNIEGWFEAGYSFNNRHHSQEPPITPGPFNHEVGNHFMINQMDIRFERNVDTTKFDVGGMIELLGGTDAGFTHSGGMALDGVDPTTTLSGDKQAQIKYQATPQFDILQAYLTVNLPVGNGLSFQVGKFATLLGKETVDPRQQPVLQPQLYLQCTPVLRHGRPGHLQLERSMDRDRRRHPRLGHDVRRQQRGDRRYG